jgi:hypothetical protein
MNQVIRARDRLVMENGSFTVSAIASETGQPISKMLEFLWLEVGTVSVEKPVKEDGDTLGGSVGLQPDNSADPAQVIDRIAR